MLKWIHKKINRFYQRYSLQIQIDSQIILSIIYLNHSGFIANKSDVKFEKNQYKVKSKELILANYEGEWGYEFKIDGVQYWKQGEVQLEPIEKMEFTLPSDSTFREDIMLLKHGYDDYAQLAKMNLENLQRVDVKLRSSHK